MTMGRVPISHKVRKLRVTVASQQLDRVGSHDVWRSLQQVKRDEFVYTKSEI
jgi:hypothetical protein